MHSRVLGMFLMNLWHFARAYIEHGNSVPLPSYIFIAFTHPRITHLISGQGGDIAPQVIRHCLGALVVNKLATDIDARTLQDPVNDAELGCLSAILGTDSQDVTRLFSYPGAIQFANMIFLASDDVYRSSWISVPDVLDVVHRTFSIISQALPAQLNTEMHLDLTDTLTDVSKGRFKLVSHLCVLKTRIRDLLSSRRNAQQSFRPVFKGPVASYKSVHCTWGLNSVAILHIHRFHPPGDH
jgi:hypothetical protein